MTDSLNPDQRVLVLVGCGAAKQFDDEITDCESRLESQLPDTATGALNAFRDVNFGTVDTDTAVNAFLSRLADRDVDADTRDRVEAIARELADYRTREVPAKDLYTSTYFRLKREFAELYGDDWLIVSAEHQVLDPSEEITTYDKSLTHMTADERSAWGNEASDQLRNIDWTAYDVVVLLLGQKYIEPIEPTLETFPVKLAYPFDHTEGNGEQNGWLKTRIQEAKTAAPDEPVTLSLGPIKDPDHSQVSLTNFDA